MGSDSAGYVEIEDWEHGIRSSDAEAVVAEAVVAEVLGSPPERTSFADTEQGSPCDYTGSGAEMGMIELAGRGMGETEAQSMIAFVGLGMCSHWLRMLRSLSAGASTAAAADKTAVVAVEIAEAAENRMDIVAAEVEMGTADTAAEEIDHTAAVAGPVDHS